jgi:hypothetical protein
VVAAAKNAPKSAMHAKERTPEKPRTRGGRLTRSLDRVPAEPEGSVRAL